LSDGAAGVKIWARGTRADILAILMNDIALLLAPLASFWVVYTAMLAGARYVNELRDTIVLKYKDEMHLSAPHRRAYFFDGVLCMFGVVSSALLFGLILIWCGAKADDIAPTLHAKWVWQGVAVFPFVCAMLFIVCGVSDIRPMLRLRSLNSAASSESHARRRSSLPR